MHGGVPIHDFMKNPGSQVKDSGRRVSFQQANNIHWREEYFGWSPGFQ